MKTSKVTFGGIRSLDLFEPYHEAGCLAKGRMTEVLKPASYFSSEFFCMEVNVRKEGEFEWQR